MKRHVLTALPVLALAGLLTACGGAPADDATSAPVEATSPDSETVEAPADETPAPEPVEEPAEDLETLAYETGFTVEELESMTDDQLAEVKGLSASEKEEVATMLGYPEWGETIASDDGQYEYTVTEPKAAQVQTWDADPESDETVDGIEFEITFTNNTSANAVPSDSDFLVFGGMSDGIEALEPGAWGTEIPTNVPPHKTVTWTERYIVDSLEDTTVTIVPPYMEDGTQQSEILYGVAVTAEEMIADANSK